MAIYRPVAPGRHLISASAEKRGSSRAPIAPIVGFFRRFVTSELALGVLVLLSVGLLTALPPARTTASVAAVQANAKVDDLTVTLSVQPGKVGLNTFSLQVTSNGQPVSGAKEVALRFTPTIANLAPSQPS